MVHSRLYSFIFCHVFYKFIFTVVVPENIIVFASMIDQYKLQIISKIFEFTKTVSEITILDI